MTNEITIDGRKIGLNHPPYIIAELSANHNGSLERALEFIDKAKETGVDAVKIQTYTADTITIDCHKPDFMIENGGLWDGQSLHDLYKSAETPFEWHEALFTKAREAGITLFSSPFDHTAVDLLENLNAPAYKIASFEAIDLPLIKLVAATGKPIIISTGMANLEEITEAVEAARSAGCTELALLHCISSYPAPIDQSNLFTIPDIAKRFNVVTGLSDHTMGNTVAIASVALGACIIEKHCKIDDNDEGPDTSFSLTIPEMKNLCLETANAWSAMGGASYDRKPAEESNVQFRRSLYFVEDIIMGEEITKENMRSIRPGFGIAPKYYDEILGKKATQNIERGTPVNTELVK